MTAHCYFPFCFLPEPLAGPLPADLPEEFSTCFRTVTFLDLIYKYANFKLQKSSSI